MADYQAQWQRGVTSSLVAELFRSYPKFAAFHAPPMRHFTRANEQPAGTVVARGAAKNARGRSVSRREVGADAGGSALAARGRLEVGHTPLSGYGPPGGSERGGMSGRPCTSAATFSLTAPMGAVRESTNQPALASQ